MKKIMLINAKHEECRIAIVTDGSLTELYTERASAQSRVGNIYKGRITNVEPSIQAAFVDFGTPKNGFLHISDLHPQHFPRGQKQAEAVGRKRARRDRPPIQECLRRGQNVVVQVTREGIGTKGATLTTYLSIPGRYLVLMPGMQRLGVSRKIEDESARGKMREVLAELKPPADLGFIVRTAGVDRPKRDIQRDMSYLVRLWNAVQQRSKDVPAPSELYQESDLVIRTIRDVYNTDIERIVCDDESVAFKVKEFFDLTMPRSAHRVELYEGDVGLFAAFDLEKEMESINASHVPLPAGGSLVIDQTEALVAIDVNSGRLRETSNAEATALRTNLEAAQEVCRQLRLRDLGGVVVIDFIDMVEERNRRKIENLVRDCLKNDRARTKVLKMSRFGIIEMTRQRVRPSLISSVSAPCAHCGGSGRVQSEESQALSLMRTIHMASGNESIVRVELTAPPAVAEHLLNRRRGEICQLERERATTILIRSDPSLPTGTSSIVFKDARGSPVQWDPMSVSTTQASQAPTREITSDDLKEHRKRRSEAERKKREQMEEAGQIPDKAPEKAIEAAPDQAQQARPDDRPTDQPATPVAKKSGRRRRGRRSNRKPPAPSLAAESKPDAAVQDSPDSKEAEAKPPTDDKAAPDQVAAPQAKPAKRPRHRGGRRRRKPQSAPTQVSPVDTAPPKQ